jgi:hypothetical protein
MYLTIILLPLIGSIYSGLYGRKIGTKGSQLITTALVMITTLLAIIAYIEVGLNNIPVSLKLFRWVDSESLNIWWGFYFDSLTVSMLLPVLIISSLVHLYSIEYMSHDPLCVLGKCNCGDKSSNSGDPLKLMVPSNIWKNICGWINHSCKVISHKMIEKEIGNRGSKSNNIIICKRATSKWWLMCSNITHLRCTLMGFERNYQIKNLSNQLNKKQYSTLKFSPWFWTGLIDAEGSFSIIIDKKIDRKLGWRVQSKFQIGLHIKDINLLLKLQQYLEGIGTIHKYPKQDKVIYSIDSNKDLQNLLTHFNKYPLISEKAADLYLFKQAVELITNKTHLTEEGLLSIVNIKASMNLGLSDKLKTEFKGYIPVERPVIKTENIPDPFWISGFVSGEGCFDALITNSSNKIGKRIQLRLRIVQHERDLKLMENIIKYLGTGKIYKYPDKLAVSLTILKFSDQTEKIIPFFNKYPIDGIKLNDYLDWCKINQLMNNGLHLTNEGLNIIQKIKSGMNKGRS